jgi:hypothetical protein
MKNLYARLVQRLSRRSGATLGIRDGVCAADGAWTLGKDGSIKINRGAVSPRETASGRSGAP